MLLSLLLILMFSCNEAVNKDPEQPAANEPVDTLRDETDITNRDSLQLSRLEKLGGVTLLQMDKTGKCNLSKGKYILNKVVTDSSDLAFIVGLLANKVFQSSKKDIACPYPVMSAVYLYLNQQRFKIGESVASCTITPRNYSGDIWVNMYDISNFKKEKH